MKTLIAATVLVLTALSPAFAAEDGPFKLKKGFFVANDYPGGQRDVIHGDGHVALRELDDVNERIGHLQRNVEARSRRLRNATGWVSDLEEASMKGALAADAEELAKWKEYKLKTFGEDADKIAKKLREKSARLGSLYAEAGEKAQLAERYARKAPVKTQTFSNLEDEVGDLSKQLFKGLRKEYKEALARAKTSKFRWAGSSRYKRAAVVAIPLAGAAAVGIAVDADSSEAQASTVQNNDLPAQNDEVRQSQDIEVLDAN